MRSGLPLRSARPLHSLSLVRKYAHCNEAVWGVSLDNHLNSINNSNNSGDNKVPNPHHTSTSKIKNQYSVDAIIAAIGNITRRRRSRAA